MKRLDRFILKSFIGPFVAILFVVLFVLVMQFLWVYIDELVGKGLGFRVILEFMFWGAWTVVPLSLPLATLLSAMMIVGQMAENNELIAIKSAGISLTRVMVPILIVSAIISVGAFYVANKIVPIAYNKIFTLRDDIGHTKDQIKIPSGIFYDGIDGYILRVEENDDLTGMMHGVMVYDHTSRKGNVSLTLADSAIMKMSKDKDYLTFTLFSGANYQETNTVRNRDTTRELNRIEFSRQDLLIRLENYAFEQSDSSRFGDQAKSKDLPQLRHDQDSLSKMFTKIHNNHVRQLLATSALSKSNQLDTAFASLHLPPFSYPNYMEWDSFQDKLNDYQQAAGKTSELTATAMTMRADTYENQFYLRRAELELYRRYSQALACLILFFIGAPLGALIRKGGLGTSAIVSVLFFLLYWVVDITGQKLAKDGAIDTFSGAFFSTYVLLPLGGFLTWKAVHDSSLLNMDQFKAGWRKLKSKFLSLFRKTRIVYMGTPEFAVAPLDALIKAGYNIVGVVTVADKPSGRGLKVNESAVKKYAVEHGIPVLQPLKLKDPEFLEALSAWKADLFVVVAFRMLPEEVWMMPKLGTFNLHAALLPQYRGAAPINWAVINGERMTGVTTFMIDKNIDTGGIILRQEYRIKDADTAGDVHDALMEIGSSLVVDTVEGLIEGNAETRLQRSFIQGSEVLRPAPKLTRELCHIDWEDGTTAIYNLIRGLSPYPAAFTQLVPADGSAGPQQLKIYSAVKVFDGLDGMENAAPGDILSDGRTYLAVKTLDGAISILDLQLSGKKRMDVASFLLGFRNPETWKTTKGTSKAEIANGRS